MNTIQLSEAIKKAEMNGKEPFDFKKFARYYAHDVGTCEKFTGNESAAVQQYYKQVYYLDFPQVLTIQEFANFLDEIEANS